MSVPLTPLVLALNSKTVIDLGQTSLDTLSWMELINHSPYSGLFTLGNYALTIPAWYDYPIALHPNNNPYSSFSGQASFTPTLQTIPGTGFTAQLNVILYAIGESPASTTPQPLGGGPIDLSQATTVQNIGNAPATPFIFAEPAGDTSTNGAVNINNQGQETLGDSLYNGALTILGTVATSQVNLLKDILTFFFNNKSVSFTGKYTIVNGDTSGNIQLFECIQGSAKLKIIIENAYISGQKSISLLDTITASCVIVTGNNGLTTDGGYQVTSGGNTQNWGILNTLNVAGGSTAGQASIFRFSIGFNGAWDTLVIPARTSAKTSTSVIFGQ